MKRVRYLLTLILGLTVPLSSAWAADEDALKAAEELLNTLNMETLLSDSIDAVLTAQVQQEPQLRQHEQAMRTFLRKHMSYASLKPDFLRIYADAFTADELRQLSAFYRTPLGIKTVQLMPQLMQQGSELGMRRVQENLPELEAMIAESANAAAEANAKKQGD